MRYESSSGENNYNWKGEEALVSTKHMWLRNNFGAANRCDMSDSTCKGKFHWSNKDHKYCRDISNWQQLCASHHKRYDDKKFNRIHYNLGRRKYKNRECLVCLSLFYPKKVTAKFCSQSCSMTYRNNVILEKGRA